MPNFYWMPTPSEWQHSLRQLPEDGSAKTWSRLRELANFRLNFAETLQLGRALQKRFGKVEPEALSTKPIRLAVLGSSTVDHLLPGIRIGGLRKNIWISTYTASYGQFLQELLDPGSSLHEFRPNVVLFALDALHLFGTHHTSPSTQLDEACEKVLMLWQTAQKHFGCQVIQQTVVPLTPALLGQNEHRLAYSLRRQALLFNERLRALAEPGVADVLAIDEQIMIDGLSLWHDPALWHRAKQEVSPVAAALYGDLVARLIAAGQGLSAKCLVLDLDNTLWGGVVGDEGVEGIKLGQGSAAGEAFLAMQRYALGLSQRGIILAVCSKNDEANALLPFDQHPEMILKRNDIACFMANWNDKAANLREIARRLNIGLDTLVFVDDNPFERNLVRQELPMVAVPELPDDPAYYPDCINAAGYFEALSLTQEDRERTQQYQANIQREELKASATDLDSYLEGLKMELSWSPFKRVDLQRIVQLINKTNQFNLTTRRYTEAEVISIMEDPRALTLQLRLSDRFGDNGMIGIIIAKSHQAGSFVIESWQMSCRVLGRGVEEATLGLIVDEARRLGGEQLIGEFRPTAKNGMVKDHYAKMGFTKAEERQDGCTSWVLALKHFTSPPRSLSVKKV